MDEKMRLAREGRAEDELRRWSIEPGWLKNADGSALIRCGDTIVACAATIESAAPKWLAGTGKGWVTAEYGMLPRSTHQRMKREAADGRQGGRTVEIQRLIGRSLRASVDLTALNERRIVIDCDVLQADGGTRTASITGGYVALRLALKKMIDDGRLRFSPVKGQVAAVSVGYVNGRCLLDLDYPEDSGCDCAVNIAMTDEGELVEIQGTAEGNTFGVDGLQKMIAYAKKGLGEIFEIQKAALREAGVELPTF